MAAKTKAKRIGKEKGKRDGVPSVRTTDRVIAILCSDIHLSHFPPIARSAEGDWYAAMRRPLKELTQLATKYNAPIVCAGDIFDKWNPPPELINFALKYLPPMFAVPGQHDLPQHRYEDIKRTAYWTLVQAQRVKNIEYDDPIILDGLKLVLFGFPWGTEIRPRESQQKGFKHLAVVHSYIWDNKDHAFPNAPKEKKLPAYFKSLRGYDAAVFGDNHSGFITYTGETRIANTGTFMRRKIDEINYRPMVGLLVDKGYITPHYLDCSEDKFLDTDKALAAIERATELGEDIIKELSELGNGVADFIQALREYFTANSTGSTIRKMILEATERSKK